MKVTLRINYKTNWRENIWVCGSIKALGKWDTTAACPMLYIGNGEWETTLDFKKNKQFQYKYILEFSNKSLLWEGGKNREFDLSFKQQVEIRDFWRPQIDQDNIFFTKVFSEALMNHSKSSFIDKSEIPEQSILFQLRVGKIPKGKAVGLCGNNKEMGNWAHSITMKYTNDSTWKVAIDISSFTFPLDYKYVIIDQNSGEIELWEDGHERSIFHIDRSNQQIAHIQNDEKFRFPDKKWKGAGVAVPVFSLRSQDSFGIGEFYDLKKLIDWAKKVGLKIIQLLPINETVATHSWLDSYPYKAISIFALHPIYLNLQKIVNLVGEKLQDEIEISKDYFNSKPYVDYEQVANTKSRYFKIAFDQTWETIKQSKAYLDFFKSNQEWMEPYAAFCFLRDRYQTSDFNKWNSWSIYNPEKVKKLVDPTYKNHEHIAIHYFIQYHLHTQLNEVVEYAHQQGIALKGDIPIGISPNSIEAWTEPQLFNLNGQAGAPPDDFATLGQNWGFPTYNWEIMAKDNFAWWKKRLKMMSIFFDAYRIDHILGFFRIWEIPQHALHGLLGYFSPSLPLLPDEIMDYNIWFDNERFTKPYIRGHFLHEFFGEYTNEVRALYLNETEPNVFELKKGYTTQKEIFNHFTPETYSTQRLSEKNVIIRDGLIGLLDEVLFIKDPNSISTAYHPRIVMQYTNSYRELDSETKKNLDDLYINYFYKRHDTFWKNEAMKKLPSLIESSNMMVCGEDLGMVPDSVPEVMEQLNILSLEIQRMPKTTALEFQHPNNAPYLSVCTTSTHDMSTIRGWWEENREKTQRFYHTILGHNDQAPYFAEPWVCREIINQHLFSSSMWTIFPIQDLIAMDSDLRWDETDKERINIPSDDKNKWRYRMILSLEELLKADEFNKMLSSMINHSGRNN